MASGNKYYNLYGCAVESEIGIKGLSPSDKAPPDVTIELAVIPSLIPRSSAQRSAWHAWPSRFYLDVSSVGRYLVIDGNKILVDPSDQCCSSKLSAFLLGSVFGALLWQRGFLLLHASAVTKNNITLAISGERGAGKSTAVSALMLNGFTFLADDICALTCNSEMLFVIQPGPPIIKLLPDAAQQFMFGFDQYIFDLLDRKRRYKVVNSVSSPKICSTLIIIKDTLCSTSVRQIHGIEKVIFLINSSYRNPLIDQLGLRKHHFSYCSLLANQVTIWEFSRNKQLTSLNEFNEIILQFTSEALV